MLAFRPAPLLRRAILVRVMSTISAFAPGVDAQDLHLDERGDLAVVTGLEDVRQRVIERLRFWRGDWYLDRTDGVPYIQEVFTRPMSAGLAASIVSGVIRSVAGVTGVRDVEATVDPVTRTLAYSARVDTVHGSTAVSL